VSEDAIWEEYQREEQAIARFANGETHVKVIKTDVEMIGTDVLNWMRGLTKLGYLPRVTCIVTNCDLEDACTHDKRNDAPSHFDCLLAATRR
jgi:hypothetical protein